MKEKYFSGIVCIFNGEKYFNRGVNCLLNQSFKDYEIILIDDGSTDLTLSLCNELAAGNKNVKAIPQENRGLGEARNTGIDPAKGNYLCFFDIDVEVDKDWLQEVSKPVHFSDTYENGKEKIGFLS